MCCLVAHSCVDSGQKLSMPVIVAPMSQQRMADDAGELAVARATAKEGTTMVSQKCVGIACNSCRSHKHHKTLQPLLYGT